MRQKPRGVRSPSVLVIDFMSPVYPLNIMSVLLQPYKSVEHAQQLMTVVSGAGIPYSIECFCCKKFILWNIYFTILLISISHHIYMSLYVITCFSVSPFIFIFIAGFCSFSDDCHDLCLSFQPMFLAFLLFMCVTRLCKSQRFSASNSV